MLGKDNEAALSDNVGAPVVPVPLRVTDCGEPEALSAMLMVADFDPIDTGLKATVNAQFAPAVNTVPQVFDSMKSSAWPVTLNAVKLIEIAPVLVKTIDWVLEALLIA